MIGRSHRGEVQRDDILALAQKLDLPAPFTLDGFRLCLQRQRRRTVHMVAVTMTPGAPSGVWLRSEGSDFLFFEEQTSLFHQAHIVLCLAAHMLAGDGREGRIDRRLVPNVAPSPRIILGAEIGNAISRSEAEAFAFDVLRRTSPFPSVLQAKCLLRRLRPLHSELLGAVPSAATGPGSEVRADPSSRLYRVVIETRDAALALRHYGAAGVAAATATHGPVGELADQVLEAALDAASLVSESNRRAANYRQRNRQRETSRLTALRADLRIDAEPLAKASAMFARSHPERHSSSSPAANIRRGTCRSTQRPADEFLGSHTP